MYILHEHMCKYPVHKLYSEDITLLIYRVRSVTNVMYSYPTHLIYSAQRINKSKNISVKYIVE
jgi:hypothetical protein